jgi:hypothetical protein
MNKISGVRILSVAFLFSLALLLVSFGLKG